MNYIKFLESKLGQFLGKSKLIRIYIAKLYIRQLEKRKIAYYPSEYKKIINPEMTEDECRMYNRMNTINKIITMKKLKTDLEQVVDEVKYLLAE